VTDSVTVTSLSASL